MAPASFLACWPLRCRPTARHSCSHYKRDNSSAASFRATISTIFALSNVGGLTLFIASGKITRDGLVASAVTVPALFVGQLLGFPIRKHVHGERFRWLVLVLMFGAAISAIVNAIV